MPKISVCIPVYNAELWLSEAIESIINQTFTDWEIVIFDDGSTDASNIVFSHYKKILQDKIIILSSTGTANRYAGQPYGTGISRNYCNKESKGEIICVQDADDISHNQRLEKTWKFFKRHKQVDLVYGSYQTIDVFGKPETQFDAEEFNAEKLLKHNYIAHPTVAYRRQGRIEYRPECKVLDDWFLYLDYIKAGKKIAKMDDVLSFYRQLPTGVSKSKLKETEEMREQFLKEANEYLSSVRH